MENHVKKRMKNLNQKDKMPQSSINFTKEKTEIHFLTSSRKSINSGTQEIIKTIYYKVSAAGHVISFLILH